MPVPTEPDWYWWSSPGYMQGEPQCLWVEMDQLTGCIVAWLGDRRWALTREDAEAHSDFLAGPLGGEFGPRIPSAERLRAMEEVIADIASNGYAPKLGMMPPFLCAFCRTPEPDHAPDCPWLRAQKEDG